MRCPICKHNIGINLQNHLNKTHGEEKDCGHCLFTTLLGGEIFCENTGQKVNCSWVACRDFEREIGANK